MGFGAVAGGACLHCHVHFLECFVCLFEESKHDASAEFSLFLVIVHFKNLLKGCRVDAVAAFRETHGTFVALYYRGGIN